MKRLTEEEREELYHPGMRGRRVHCSICGGDDHTARNCVYGKYRARSGMTPERKRPDELNYHHPGDFRT